MGTCIKVKQHFRDEYDVCVNGRCARVYAEMVSDGVALSYDSIRQWRSSPMAEEERLDVLNILLEDFESRGDKVYLSGVEALDSRHVKAAQARIERGHLRRLRS